MSRYSQPITPVSGPSNLRPTGDSQQQGTPQSGDQAPKALCTFDEHMMSMIPDYKPMSDKGLREHMYAWGANDETYDQYVQCHNRAMEEIIQRGGVRVIGMKPVPGDPNVYTVRVPDSPYVLRMWDGGMDYYGHFCLDFYDTERRVPVNLPPGHSLHRGAPSMPPGLNFAPPPPDCYLPKSVRRAMDARAWAPAPGFGSWERNLGMRSFPEGEEKWSFPEGAYIILKRDGHPDFTFQMPTMQPAIAIAQPQLGLPYY